MTNIFELEAFEQDQFEREYADWCKKYDINYIVEQDEESDPEVLDNQKN
jgi:hypothetical protein